MTHAHACLCTHAHARAHTNAQVRASCETSAVTVWMNGSAHYAQSTLLTTFSKMTAKSEHYIFDRSVENEALDWIQARARAPAHKERQPGRQTRTELGRFVHGWVGVGGGGRTFCRSPEHSSGSLVWLGHSVSPSEISSATCPLACSSAPYVPVRSSPCDS